MSTVDWQAIRKAYEQGASKNTLARVHGISRQAIIKKARLERWVVQEVTSRVPPVTEDVTKLDTSAPAIAEQARYIIAVAMQTIRKNQNISFGPLADSESHKSLKMLMDSLSQAHKIELTSPNNKPTESGLPADLMAYFDIDDLVQLAELQQKQEAIIEAARARKLEAEQGIKTIRKTG